MTLVMLGVKIIVGLSAGQVIRYVIQANTPAAIGFLGKMAVGIGGFALGGLVGSAAADYTEEEIKTIMRIIRETKEEIKKKENEQTA